MAMKIPVIDPSGLNLIDFKMIVSKLNYETIFITDSLQISGNDYHKLPYIIRINFYDA